MLHPKQQLIKDAYGKVPETLAEIAEACIAVINRTDPVVGFAWELKYSPEVGNSHYAPIAGHTNWGGRNPAAKGVRSYPGFFGRVWIRYADHCNDSFGESGNFAKTLTWPGSGGYGAYDGLWQPIAHAAYQTDGHNRGESYPELRLFSWDYRLFLTDFPGYEEEFNRLLDEFNQEAEWDLLKGRNFNSSFAVSHRFKWEDPTVKAADDAFIEYYKQMQEMDPKNNPRHETVEP